jgi:hypothetical protein
MDRQTWKGQDLEEKISFTSSEHLKRLEAPNTFDGRRRYLLGC